MDSGVYALGLVLAVVGLGLGLWRKKRQFDRTNSAGVEQFESYGRKMVATTFDRVLYGVAVALLFVGLFILAFG